MSATVDEVPSSIVAPGGGELPGAIPGRLVGRERHVLPEPDGTLSEASWLAGSGTHLRQVRPADRRWRRAIPRCLVAEMAGFGTIRHGVFHGDLHPGNVMVLPDGRYAILDYGIVGRLTRTERRAFAQMMVSGAIGDVAGQLAAFGALGAFPPGADVAAFSKELPPGVLPGGAMPDLVSDALPLFADALSDPSPEPAI